jgi:GNAT superfamily N-acetyltransferase
MERLERRCAIDHRRPAAAPRFFGRITAFSTRRPVMGEATSLESQPMNKLPALVIAAVFALSGATAFAADPPKDAAAAKTPAKLEKPAGVDAEAWKKMTDAEKQTAEVAFTVQDTWQRRGLGSYFFNRLVQIARERGVHTFYAYVLVENSGMLKIFHRSGMVVETQQDGDVVRVMMRLPERERTTKAAH